ncbi:MAG: glycosyltransferase [Gammaproteobacteria bacterium]|nr:glycosyltransferase [Gammaproteobacteria bacterium]
MMSNTFIPHVGGVARSIETFTSEYRKRGHRVLVVAPMFDRVPAQEHEVIRIPAIQHFNGSDFSVALPIPGRLSSAVQEFRPDIVHSHHPFLIGATALRIAHSHELPLVFTHHTKYEDYTHYVPGNSQAMKRFVIRLTTNYANLCDQVFAPSESIAGLIRERGVQAPIAVVPTGVSLTRFSAGNGSQFRRSVGIPDDAFVVGHLGRLAKEKNLEFLAKAVAIFIGETKSARKSCFLLIGQGPMKVVIQEIFSQHACSDLLYTAGILDSSEVASAYRAMDVFAFTSKSETQGMVLTEAMASDVPIVALDAPGVREVVRDRCNGRLLDVEGIDTFCSALRWIADLSAGERTSVAQEVRNTALEFSMERVTDRALALYQQVREKSLNHRSKEYHSWTGAMNVIGSELIRLRGIAGAVGAALRNDSEV